MKKNYIMINVEQKKEKFMICIPILFLCYFLFEVLVKKTSSDLSKVFFLFFFSTISVIIIFIYNKFFCRQRWNDMDNPIFMDYCLLSFFLLYGFIMYNHTDIMVTGAHGKLVIDSILTQNFTRYYSYVKEVSDFGATYYMPLYLVFAIWNLPVYLILSLSNPSYLSSWIDYKTIGYWITLWNKLLPIIFYFGVAYMIYKIGVDCYKLSPSRSKWLMFIWLSGPITVFIQFYFGQYDSIGLFFLLVSFYFYLRSNMKLFILFAAIAMTFKLFALLAFIPLLLLKEKRVLYIIRNLLLSISGIIICKFYIADPGFTVSKTFESNMVGRIFNSSLPVAWGSASYFLIFYIAICIYSYLSAIEDSKISDIASYILLCVYGFLFLFVDWHPQWVLYLTPFLTLALPQRRISYKNILIDTGLGLSYILYTIVVFPNSIGFNMMKMGGISQIFNNYSFKLDLLKDFITLSGRIPMSLYISLFGAMLISIIILYFPKLTIMTKDSKACSRDLIWIRSSVIMVYYIIVQVVFVITKVFNNI